MKLKVLGITGGIGSGKTTVCKIFESIGIKVFYADSEARYLMNHNLPLVNAIKSLLGEEAYDSEGKLNRAWVAKQVFNNGVHLNQLNAIVHPATKEHFQKWKEELEESAYSQAFIIKEAAILFEAGTHEKDDFIVSVYAPKSLRVQRVISRDGVEESQVLARMDKQWPDLKKIQHSDYIIFNDGEHPLIPQVLEVAKKVRSED